MKSYLLIILFCFGYFSFSQNYTPLNYHFNGTPTYGIKIKTNIPFQNGNAMPTIIFEGFEYGGRNVIDIKLNWYVYGGDFIRYNASSSGGYSPEIKLANDGGKVSIYINDKKYYTRFTIRAYSFGMSETASMFSGWTAVDEPISGTNIKTVEYNNAFSTNIVINRNGNVGIGTASPGSKLTVKGHVNIGGDGNYRLRTRHIDGKSYESTNVDNLYLNYGIGKKVYVGSFSNTSPSTDLLVSGNVGIGTTTPDAKLAVNGNIHTKEVKVDLIGWSDFVFKDSYKLPTLKEVEQHIKEKGHLKDIPSAEEVAKNGVYLGEMDSKLLQKIEELTLYTIEQQKAIDALESKNEKLEKENNELQLLYKRIADIEKMINNKR